MTGGNPAWPWRARQAWCALAALAWLSAPGVASAQTRSVETATAPARAVVLNPLTLVKTQDMDFGRIAARPAAGTVVLNPAGGCAATGGLVRVGACQPAEFAGRGSLALTVRLRVNENSIDLTGPGAAMRLDNFTVNTSGLLFLGSPGNPRYLITGLSGVFTYRVGGTLLINANQAPGVYSGTFTVRVDYL